MFKTIFFIALSSIVLLACSIYLAANAAHAHEGDLHAAFRECAEKLGLPHPKEGEERPKLSDEQKEKLHACLAEKGVKPGEHPGGEHHGDMARHHEQMKACMDAAGVKMPEHKPGEHPKMDAATEAAMKKCHEQLMGAEKGGSN